MMESREIKTGKFYYNNLFLDYIFDYKNISKFYEYDYRDIKSYKKRVFDIKADYDGEKRTEICSILENYNKKIGCGQKTLENIEKLKNSKSVVIIGGQQPGLLTGPLFMIFKILTILKLSNFFHRELEIPVIPCFWNASDDDSADQINNLNIINGEISNIKLDLSGFNKKTRYSDIDLPEDRLKGLIERLEDLLRPTGFKSGIIDFLKNSLSDINKNYSERNRVNITTFFSGVITRMFSDRGLVIIDPADNYLKKSSQNLLKFDVDNHNRISGLINSTGEELNSSGYHNQLNSVTEILDFFYCESGIRKRIYPDGEDSFKIEDKVYDKKEFWDLIVSSPESISLNVVLRPLFQDSLLPVLCSICGPGEISYFSQFRAVYDLYGLKMPVIYPRFSATIIERKIKKFFKKFKITDEMLASDEEEMTKQIIRKRMEIDTEGLILDLGKDIGARLEKLERVFLDIEMNISDSFDRIKRNLKKEIKVLNKKVYSGLKKQDELVVDTVKKIYTNIFPNGNLQEREINIFSYLNKYGFEFLNDIDSAIKPMDFSHKFLEIL
ncbi:MAG: bacillithiol biosynthesis cysteine-adding enzyme BshC [Actinomycetota bacterium]|nr:bacillithiol biosynthesis cysteine-adding enzyme BshC [Actinomycetota bacterium]